MASFKQYQTKRKGKLWMFKIDTEKGSKRNNTTRRGFKTKAEAELAAAALQLQISKGEYKPDSNITFKEFTHDWLDIYEPTVKVSSFKIRKQATDILIKHVAVVKLKDFNKKRYESLLKKLANEYSENTQSIIHSTAKLIFKKAMEYGLITSDPTEHTKVIRKKKTIEELENEDVPKFLEKEELVDFLEAAKEGFKPQDYAIYLTLAYTGMRVGELMALKWSDISFEDRMIKITKTCYLEDGKSQKFILLTPKTRSSKRQIIVDDLVIKELKKLKLYQNNVKLAPGSPFVDHDFVFTADRYPGYPCNRTTIEYKMKKILKKAKINKDLSPHSLRHTHTSLLAEAGVELTSIMERLGHEDDAVTKRVYLHITESKRAIDAVKFSELMNSAVKSRSKRIN